MYRAATETRSVTFFFRETARQIRIKLNRSQNQRNQNKKTVICRNVYEKICDVSLERFLYWALCSSYMSAHAYKTTRCHNPEDHNQYSHHLENLKS
jgi:hypothetical protein